MKKFLVVSVFILLVSARPQAAQYFQDFSAAALGATEFGDGSQVVSAPGVAGVQNVGLKELRLTPKLANTTAAFVAPSLNTGRKTLAFSAKWNASMIYDATAAGDGFQFTFGNVKPTDALNLWNKAVGITFRVQTASANPSYAILINGQDVTNKPFVLQPSSEKRRYFEVDWRYTNGVTVKLDGIPLLNAPTPGFVPSFDDRFVWIAKNGETGGEIAIDNIAVVTGGTLAIVPGSGFFSSQRNPNYGPMKAYDDDNESEFAVFAHSGFVGGNVSPARSLMFYSLTSGFDAPDPHNWTLEGGPNSSGPWTPVVTSDWEFSTRQETRIWPVTNNAAFPSFRFSFPTNNSATLATYVGDIRLLEFKPFTPAFIADILQTAPNQLQLTFLGTPSSNYVAQFTTDFLSWTDIATNTGPENGSWSVVDTTATNTARWYRLRQ
jgi:hypothetical protein